MQYMRTLLALLLAGTASAQGGLLEATSTHQWWPKVALTAEGTPSSLGDLRAFAVWREGGSTLASTGDWMLRTYDETMTPEGASTVLASGIEQPYIDVNLSSGFVLTAATVVGSPSLAMGYIYAPDGTLAGSGSISGGNVSSVCETTLTNAVTGAGVAFGWYVLVDTGDGYDLIAVYLHPTTGAYTVTPVLADWIPDTPASCDSFANGDIRAGGGGAVLAAESLDCSIDSDGITSWSPTPTAYSYFSSSGSYPDYYIESLGIARDYVAWAWFNEDYFEVAHRNVDGATGAVVGPYVTHGLGYQVSAHRLRMVWVAHTLGSDEIVTWVRGGPNVTLSSSGFAHEEHYRPTLGYHWAWDDEIVVWVSAAGSGPNQAGYLLF